MIRVSFEVFASSPSIETLEIAHREACLQTEILREGNLQRFCLLSVNRIDYDLDDVITLIIETIRKYNVQLSNQTQNKIEFTVDIEIILTDADETPIPGILFPADYISLASEFNVQTWFHLNITSSTPSHSMNSGAYLYIESNNEINTPEISRVAGIQPSVVYRKGCMGRYSIVNFNAWGLKVTSDNQLPNVSAMALMQKLERPKELGLYCKKNNLKSHVDITCYSIPSVPLCFQIAPAFFTFLYNLNVLYIDMDFMV